MRLTTNEVKTIIDSFNKYFKSGNIYLFGSRVDDSKKGGDIDLYIDTADKDNLYEKKLKLILDIKSKIGEQKIDLIISKDKTRIIEQEVLEKGIKLDIEKIKQEKVINECDIHLRRLDFASNQLKNIFPLDENSYMRLSEEEIQSIDQFLYRFSKLQDTIGEKLIKIVFSLYEENIEKFTFIDILNRLEKVEILTLKDWKKLRDIRNDLSHKYDDDPEESSIIINNIYIKKELLKSIYLNLKKIIQND
jgi:predicted nucleotidyltransferase